MGGWDGTREKQRRERTQQFGLNLCSSSVIEISELLFKKTTPLSVLVQNKRVALPRFR